MPRDIFSAHYGGPFRPKGKVRVSKVGEVGSGIGD